MAPKVKPLVAHDGSCCCNGGDDTELYEQCVAPGCDAFESKSWYFCDELQEDGAGSLGFRRWLCAGNSGTAHRNVRAKEKGWQKWDGVSRTFGADGSPGDLPWMTANSIANGYVKVAGGGTSCRKLLIYPPPESASVELFMFDETAAPILPEDFDGDGYQARGFFLPFRELEFDATFEPVQPDCLAALRAGQALELTIAPISKQFLVRRARREALKGYEGCGDLTNQLTGEPIPDKEKHIKEHVDFMVQLAKLDYMKPDATFSVYALFSRAGDQAEFARGCLRGLTYPWEEQEEEATGEREENEEARLSRLLDEIE